MGDARLIAQTSLQVCHRYGYASFHKRLDIQEAIRHADHILLFLPPYSPQLNQIEHKWAQTKAIRKQKHCSISELFTLYEI